MADRPILFSGPMVLALIAGRKTETRRIIKPQPPENTTCAGFFSTGMFGWMAGDPADLETWEFLGDFKTPFMVGDRMYVRETLACCIDWGLFYDAHGGIGPSEEHFLRDERAAAIVERYSRDDETLWNVPSIFMPRWASRLTLTVTDVRVERLQDISEADAKAEGVEQDSDGWRDYLMPSTQCCSTAKDSYRTLWDSINGKGSWDTNPWVVAYTFTVRRGNIDEIARIAA